MLKSLFSQWSSMSVLTWCVFCSEWNHLTRKTQATRSKSTKMMITKRLSTRYLCVAHIKKHMLTRYMSTTSLHTYRYVGLRKTLMLLSPMYTHFVANVYADDLQPLLPVYTHYSQLVLIWVYILTECWQRKRHTWREEGQFRDAAKRLLPRLPPSPALCSSIRFGQEEEDDDGGQKARGDGRRSEKGDSAGCWCGKTLFGCCCLLWTECMWWMLLLLVKVV